MIIATMPRHKVQETEEIKLNLATILSGIYSGATIIFRVITANVHKFLRATALPAGTTESAY